MTSNPSPPAAPPRATRTLGPSAAIVRDAIGIAAAGSLVALAVNALRAEPLPLVARAEMETMVPCPEPMGAATPVPPGDERVKSPLTLLVDARSPEEHAAWHPDGAVSFPFDWLAESDEIARQAAEVAKAIARSRRQHVVVYGDGGDPDSGEQWAALLSGAGIKNVVFVKGGAPALGQPGVGPPVEASAAPAGHVP
ncbi:MAG TPA: rhodanese-like domain-containing protein [Polyangiaceae bacterium]|nr:rhodanese-like domain-containing protein [Polyangiaceae bacterium]